MNISKIETLPTKERRRKKSGEWKRRKGNPLWESIWFENQIREGSGNMLFRSGTSVESLLFLVCASTTAFGLPEWSISLVFEYNLNQAGLRLLDLQRLHRLANEKKRKRSGRIRPSTGRGIYWIVSAFNAIR